MSAREDLERAVAELALAAQQPVDPTSVLFGGIVEDLGDGTVMLKLDGSNVPVGPVRLIVGGGTSGAGDIGGEITDAQHGERSEPAAHDHDDLRNVTANQHHAQSHSHGSHTGIGVDDHHNRDHAIAGATHTFPGGTVNFLREDGTFQPVSVSTVGDLIIVLDGGGGTVPLGVAVDVIFDFAATITQWTLLADVSGSVVVDLWKDTYANYPPTVADTITAAAKPTITTAVKAQSAVLTGWTTAIAAGDTLRVNIDSLTSIKRLTIAIKYTR